jgi:hypothetical protein
VFKASKDRQGALIDLQLFRSRVFSASAVTQFTTNGLSFAGQMLIPIYLTRAASESPSVAGWLMAPLGLGMMCTYPWLGKLTQRCGIRGTSTGGATVAFLGTLPFLYLSSHPLNLLILAGTLFIRGGGMSAVGIPSISAAYGSVRKEQLPMATTSLNICATSWRSHTDDPLRKLSRLAAGCSFARQCNQSVYDHLCPLMQLACVADCSCNEAPRFPWKRFSIRPLNDQRFPR